MTLTNLRQQLAFRLCISLFRGCLWALILSAIGGLSGCATYGVERKLQPFAAITQKSEPQLRQEGLSVLQSLNLKQCDDIGIADTLLCHLPEGYFLVALSGDTVKEKYNLFLGATPEESVESLISIQQRIQYQKDVAEQELAQVIAGVSQSLNGTGYAASNYSAVAPTVTSADMVSAQYTISEVLSNGAFIVLSDNSVWKVDAVDTFHTALWLPLTEVVISESQYQGYVSHKAINLGDSQSVSVTYLGGIALRSTINGEFKGWDGETVFSLTSGHVLQQANYAYHYHYSYMPKVILINTSVTGVYVMAVNGVSETIHVRVLN